MKMFSATVTSGQSAISWCTKPMPRLWAMAGEVIRTSLPSRNICPESGRRMPSMIFISVDLPAPFSPASAWISPRRSSKLTFRSAWIGSERLAQAGDRRGSCRSLAAACSSRSRENCCLAGYPTPLVKRRGVLLVRSAGQLGSRPSMYLFRSKESAFSLVITANPLSMKGICIGLYPTPCSR